MAEHHSELGTLQDKIEFDEAQQKLVDKLVGEARVKAREVAKTQFETDQAKAKEDSERAALVANQKWRELAERHEARVKELEPFEGQAKAYSELIAGMLKDKTKELGDAAKKAIDALPKGMSPLEKLDWLNKNEGLFTPRSSGAVASTGVGTPQAKRAAGQQQETPVKISRFPIRL